jgi:hypothetical protein
MKTETLSPWNDRATKRNVGFLLAATADNNIIDVIIIVYIDNRAMAIIHVSDLVRHRTFPDKWAVCHSLVCPNTF